MSTVIVFFLVLSVGSAAGAVLWQRQYEEMLPLTSAALVLLLFLSGILGSLKIGVYVVWLLTAGIYLFLVVWVVEKKCLKNVLPYLFTPGFFVFCVLFCLAVYFNFGKMADGWDEFSHWADIVKAMVTIDDFGTNANSGSHFQSYPPGMALFQYFLQKLNGARGGQDFCEWMLYFAYQIFCFTFFMPFLKNLQWKRLGGIVCTGIVIFLSPLLFYSDLYTKIYIDPFLGILAGTGLAVLFLREEKDLASSVNLLLTCSMLVLAKDAGLLFAAILACAYAADCLQKKQVYIGKETARKDSEKSKAAVGSGRCQSTAGWDEIRQEWLCILAAAGAVLVPKLLWNYNIHANKAKINFSGKFQWGSLWQVLIGQDQTYYTTVFTNFWQALAEQTTKNLPSLNYWLILLLLLLLLYGGYRMYAVQRVDSKRRGRIFMTSVLVQTVVYVCGLCVTYMFKFSEYEAVRLASFERYMNILCLALWIAGLLLVLGALHCYYEKQRWADVVIVCLLLVVSPVRQVSELFHRLPVSASIETRAPYEAFGKKIAALVPAGSMIYFISQETNGFDYWVMRYTVRPNRFNPSFSWSIGQAFYEGDIWTRAIAPEEWKQELTAEYEYVAIYQLNEYFVQNFAVLFENPDEIGACEVYRVDKSSGMLVKCGS